MSFLRHTPSFHALTAVLALLGGASVPLHAQATYSSGRGASSTYGYYDPSVPIRAPQVAGPGVTQPAMPVIPMDQYLAKKAAVTQNSQASFALPLRLEVSPPVQPLAPAVRAPISTDPTISWEGIQNTQLQPPSPDLAVGPNDALMVVNSSIAQYSKAGVLKKLTPFQEWFLSVLATVCPAGSGQCLIYDPSVRYDQLHGRFVFLATSRDFYNNFSYLLISVSNGATFDSGWKIWALDARRDGINSTANWGDFWRMGFDNVALYLSGNMFSISSAFQYGKIRVIKKSELYNPATTTLNFQDLWNMKNEDGTTASSLLPVHQRGKPTLGNASFFVNAADTPVPSSYLTIWKIADPLATPLVAARSTVRTLWPYDYPAPAPQAGGPARLDSGDTRVLKAVYRDGYIYTARDTGYPEQATTITYDIIDTTRMAATSQARLLNTNAFYPAFDIPATTAPGAQFASANMIFGTTTAANGTVTFAGISRLKNGEGYFDFGAGGISRWGDYFGGAVDPIDGGLWVSGQYAKSPSAGFGNWGTWAGYFPWTTTPAFDDVASGSFFYNFVNVLRLWQVTLGCTSTSFCPTSTVTRGQLAAFIVRALAGENFQYTTTPYFTDVPATYPFFSYIQKLRDLGITTGCTVNQFCPDGTVSRGEIAAFMVRAKLGALFGDNFAYPQTPSFTDVPASHPFFSYIQKLYELGITSGCGPAAFCPASQLTRQEMAVFLTRAFLN